MAQERAAPLSIEELLAAEEPEIQSPADPEKTPTDPDKKTEGTEKKTEEPPAISELENLLTRPVEVAVQPQADPLSPSQLVNSVTRQESTVGKSPAAIFVITNDMIRRNGATSIPEVLRMAPGVNVSRIDANKWAISSRGFNNRFASNLLVQVDGRVVYNPVFNGVYWDAVDYPLQDIERIEVIRGPGATVWGSNAVNGIINIISKNSKDTQGLLISAGGGSEDRGMTSLRYGGGDGDDISYRFYGNWFERDRAFLPSGGSQLLPPPAAITFPFTQAKDDWRKGQTGFRFDWEATDDDTFVLQGDLFQVESGRADFRPITSAPFVVQNDENEVTTGGNLLTRWQHQTGEDSSWALQLYWDHFGRISTNDFFEIRADTLDVDFQHQFPVGERQQFIYGAGYRAVDSFFGGDGFAIGTTATPIASATPIPVDRTLFRYAAFLQDEFTLVEDQLYFTAGSKFEHNTLAGYQYQPTGRLLWAPTEQQSIWGAVSRAIRTPSIRDDAIVVTGVPFPPLPVNGFGQTRGSSNLNAEDLMAYELGYRSQPTEEFSFDTALFYNVYNNLVAFRGVAPAPVPGPPGTLIFPAIAVNGLSAETYGIEFSASWDVSEDWRLQGNYSFLQMQVHRDAGLRASAEFGEGQSPQNQVYLQSSWDLTEELEFDLMGRYVEQLTRFPSAAPNTVPSYITLDARLGWKPNEEWELSLVGQNLLDSHHLEFGGNQFLSAPLIEMQRGVFAMATWRH